MHRRQLLASCALLSLISGAAAAAPRATSKTLAVAAAANLKTAAEELKKVFQAEHPGVEVTLLFGASGALFSQLQNGAPFDLFLSADRDFPARLVQAKLARAADERVYAFGKLVAWVPAASPLFLERRGLAALGEPGVKRIALANPAVAPFGRATEAALKNAGVYQAVQDKLVLGTSVAQTAQFATTGAADVAFLPLSLTLGKELASGRVYAVPVSLYPRIEQSGIVLAASLEPALARAFLELLTSEKGRAILLQAGYGLP